MDLVRMDDQSDFSASSIDTPIPVGPWRAMPTSMLSTGGEEVMATHRTLELRTLGGMLPDDLVGHIFVAGSIATPGRPAFSGEGTVYRMDFTDCEVKLKQAVFRPPCFMIDHALQDSERGGLLGFHDLGLTRLSPMLGVRTVLSNSPVQLGDRMLITTDAGRPWEFDPVTLELVTPIGKTDEWIGAIPAPWVFPLLLTSAHPAEDRRTGEFFTVNYANPGAGNPGFTHLIRWHNRGHLEHFQLIDSNTGDPVVIEQCVHQVAITKNHIVLQDSAFVVELRQMAFDAAELLLPGIPVRDLLGGSQMRAQRPTTVLYLIPRKRLRPRSGGPSDHPTHIPCMRVEIPGESVHFYVQYDDDEKLEVIVPHTPTLDVSEWVREGELMVDGSRATEEIAGMQIPCALTQGTLAVHHIDPRTGELLAARLTRSDETWGLALGTHAPGPQEKPIEVVYFNTSGFAPELVPQRVLKAYQGRVDAAIMPVKTGKPPRLLSFEVATGKIESYLCPRGWSMLSPTFVPRRGGTGGPRDGYLVCLAHSADSVPRPHDTSGEEVWVFDAADLAAGPICRLGHPELDFAFTVHSTWVPELRPSRRDYRVNIAEDLDLNHVTRRSFGQLAFWDIFSAAVSAAMQHDTVNQLLHEDVLPHFDR
jgi:carotenoid cleavage dioxygenase-like enzyme